ncbi:DUF3019 domain-containing protein [Shewanella schlegeliana]|uniref:DUF3019 domain-containing protein n=1 Tax=Shewanella schlegeliana TaxID=190308 RepID=A0ABS1SUY0_9GAMM|nr:DUF3019 domain-containing protein [Shewanella schlegeliana]MBL4912333.1 DUF3019 domain-containing protein [Shewanella schlegeliana]MCL1108198.1 DUF3019 domain-containing protein [Shewanella schlegeliana]GIU22156.1 DUF3019 domain-containing protein [Shewanella schlegeliana]
MSATAAAIDSTEDSAPDLRLSPELCITSENAQSCDIEVTLEWEMLTGQTICIISDYKNLKKWCSPSPDIHSLTINISSDRDIQFVMIDKDTHETLAGVKLKVTPASSPQVRRRYRNPWSLF